jgi:hypothetical protein
MINGKCLIAYISRKGANYVNGNIVNLTVGNTEVIANMIQNITGGDMFFIEGVKAYPTDYHETTDVAKAEFRENARPELTNFVTDMDSYGVIFLGYPNWWGTMPMPVFTFLESHDFSGKTIIPFCTHEGSRMGHSESDIRKLCPKAKIEIGFPIKGSKVQGAEKEISKWIETL